MILRFRTFAVRKKTDKFISKIFEMETSQFRIGSDSNLVNLVWFHSEMIAFMNDYYSVCVRMKRVRNTVQDDSLKTF